MIKLKREQESPILGRQQWWDVGYKSEVLVSLDSRIYSLHITDENKKDVTKIIGEKLNADLLRNYKITAGIDSYFVSAQA